MLHNRPKYISSCLEWEPSALCNAARNNATSNGMCDRFSMFVVCLAIESTLCSEGESFSFVISAHLEWGHVIADTLYLNQKYCHPQHLAHPGRSLGVGLKC